MNLLFLLLMDSVLLGLAIGAALGSLFQWSGFYPIPVAGVFGGAIGGIIAGMTYAFLWKVSKTIKTILLIILVGIALLFVFSGDLSLVVLVMIPGIVAFLIVYFITLAIAKPLTKSPVNWWLFGSLLVVGTLLSTTIVLFLAFFSAGFMAQ